MWSPAVCAPPAPGVRLFKASAFISGWITALGRHFDFKWKTKPLNYNSKRFKKDQIFINGIIRTEDSFTLSNILHILLNYKGTINSSYYMCNYCHYNVDNNYHCSISDPISNLLWVTWPPTGHHGVAECRTVTPPQLCCPLASPIFKYKLVFVRVLAFCTKNRGCHTVQIETASRLRDTGNTDQRIEPKGRVG